MTAEQPRADRHPTDSPDGTTALSASQQPPGESVPATGETEPGDRDAFDDEPAPDEPAAAFDGPVLPGESRAGYDVDAVSGDTEAVRPQ